MELSDYWRVMRRWGILIIAGTVVAALVGYGMALWQQGATPTRYAGTATLVVNYVTPPGVPYIPTLSTTTETNVLSGRIHDPGALRRVAAQAHVALSQVQDVTALVDAKKPLITIQVVGGTPQAVAAVAQGMAQYLAAVETQQVQAQTAVLSRAAASAMAQAQQRWREAQAHYYLVCGCIAGQHRATVDPATLARLRFTVDKLRAAYLAAVDRYMALETNSVPVALVTPGTGGPLTTTYPSLIQTVLPAAVLGVLASMGLATLLDHRRAGRGPRLVHALRAGESLRVRIGQARVPARPGYPGPQSTRTPPRRV
jgi:hypothetical protein